MRTFSAVLLFGAFVCSCAAVANDDKSKPAIVFTSVVKKSDLFDQLSYPGRVVSKVNTIVLSEADGVISKIFASLGQGVRRRARIVQIEHTDPVFRYAPVTVISPVSGVVSSVEVTEGTQVTKGQRLATITDPAQIRIVAEIPSPDLPLLRAGDSGELRLTADGKPITVRVTGISPFVDPATGTASCELEILDGAKALRPGQVGQLSFKASAHQGIEVPDYAVVYKGQATLVRIVEGGKAHQLKVALGRKQKGRIEITDGLRENSVLIERASRFIDDGETVTVQQQ
jgi:multidrug efflux pump subunit AcrA (membrane-fusion protein)